MLKGLVFAEAQLDPQLFGTNGAHSLRRRSQGLVAQLVGQGQDDLGTVVLRHVHGPVAAQLRRQGFRDELRVELRQVEDAWPGKKRPETQKVRGPKLAARARLA